MLTSITSGKKIARSRNGKFHNKDTCNAKEEKDRFPHRG